MPCTRSTGPGRGSLAPKSNTDDTHAYRLMTLAALKTPQQMLKADYNRAVALCKASIDGGFELTASHINAEQLPFDAVNGLRRQMLSRCGIYNFAAAVVQTKAPFCTHPFVRKPYCVPGVIESLQTAGVFYFLRGGYADMRCNWSVEGQQCTQALKNRRVSGGCRGHD